MTLFLTPRKMSLKLHSLHHTVKNYFMWSMLIIVCLLYRMLSSSNMYVYNFFMTSKNVKNRDFWDRGWGPGGTRIGSFLTYSTEYSRGQKRPKMAIFGGSKKPPFLTLFWCFCRCVKTVLMYKNFLTHSCLSWSVATLLLKLFPQRKKFCVERH